MPSQRVARASSSPPRAQCTEAESWVRWAQATELARNETSAPLASRPVAATVSSTSGTPPSRSRTDRRRAGADSTSGPASELDQVDDVRAEVRDRARPGPLARELPAHRPVRVAEAEVVPAQVAEERLAQRVAGQQLAGPPHRRDEAQPERHELAHARGRRGVAHLARLAGVQRQRLVADHVQPALDRRQGLRVVQVVRRRHHGDVELVRSQHLLVGGVDGGDPELLGGRPGGAGGGRAQRHDLDAGHRLERARVAQADPGARDADPQRPPAHRCPLRSACGLRRPSGLASGEHVEHRAHGHLEHRLLGVDADPGDVRRERHLGQLEQRRAARRLVLEHVDPGAGEAPVAQRRDQRGLVDHRPAGGVDQERARPHQRAARAPRSARSSRPPAARAG